jgi:hypothetical protein
LSAFTTIAAPLIVFVIVHHSAFIAQQKAPGGDPGAHGNLNGQPLPAHAPKSPKYENVQHRRPL